MLHNYSYNYIRMQKVRTFVNNYSKLKMPEGHNEYLQCLFNVYFRFLPSTAISGYTEVRKEGEKSYCRVQENLPIQTTVATRYSEISWIIFLHCSSLVVSLY